MTRGKRPRNYAFLEKFTYYIPGVAEMFILLALLLLGTLLGSLVSLPFVAILRRPAWNTECWFPIR